MTKADLVVDVMRLGDLTRTDAETIIETIFDSVVAALRSGDKIEIRGFGSFRTRQRNPRIGRNPKTGARVEVPSKRVPYFKPSKDLRDLVNHQANGEAKAAPPASEPTTEGAATS
ncbi:MAG: HU family DNA-binding protein [Acidobacteriaceae bacterium]